MKIPGSSPRGIEEGKRLSEETRVGILNPG
jgi:hypothetical protein